ncbi:MAG: YkgJ family cysteine cluster protein [Desulfuromonadales bacterium]|nr:YkgJ family cysteine cluster protein [Desulfuromonadales bacterium]
MNEILDRYGKLLGEVDRWFDSCLSLHSDEIECHRGCSECCRGLFDITLLDALYLKRGFDLLTLAVQQAVRDKASARLEDLSAEWPEFGRPWMLNHIPEEQWDAMMPEEDETPCPLLSDTGACLVYAYRPMTCRLNGIPLIDIDGEPFFDEWCTLNFVENDPTGHEDIRHPFNDLFTRELLLFRELTRTLFGQAVSELDTIIPAAAFLDADTVNLIHLPEVTDEHILPS